MVRFIVGNLHVGTSDAAVVREFYRRFRSYAQKHGEMAPRTERRKVYRQALTIHHENQGLVREFRL